jgi:hypothetical protein
MILNTVARLLQKASLTEYADLKIIWRGEECIKCCSRDEGREYGSWSSRMWKLRHACMEDGREGQCSVCGEREDERHIVAGCRETEGGE